MTKYKAVNSPRNLSTVTDPLREYPATWELLRWYKCLRKTPYLTEVIAALVVEDRGPDYHHYPCKEDSSHWHIGRGDGNASIRQLIQSAKRRYRKAVRDEIWAEHEEHQRVVREEKSA